MAIHAGRDPIAERKAARLQGMRVSDVWETLEGAAVGLSARELAPLPSTAPGVGTWGPRSGTSRLRSSAAPTCSG